MPSIACNSPHGGIGRPYLTGVASRGFRRGPPRCAASWASTQCQWRPGPTSRLPRICTSLYILREEANKFIDRGRGRVVILIGAYHVVNVDLEGHARIDEDRRRVASPDRPKNESASGELLEHGVLRNLLGHVRGSLPAYDGVVTIAITGRWRAGASLGVEDPEPHPYPPFSLPGKLTAELGSGRGRLTNLFRYMS